MKKRRKFLSGFNFALQGIIYCIQNERHMRFHIFAAAIALLFGWYLNISGMEWLILVFSITLVIVLEMINSAIENTIDMFTNEYHPLAEVAKNVAAGAVLVAALNALVVGAVVFLPKLFNFLSNANF
ncbi:MAG: diacylglycerol kinase [Clostridia bacterium]|nr:diacylglycerol kinase [Clostridia bacterium]